MLITVFIKSATHHSAVDHQMDKQIVVSMKNQCEINKQIYKMKILLTNNADEHQQRVNIY